MLGYKIKNIKQYPRLNQLFKYYKIQPPKILISPNKTLNARSLFFQKKYIQINQGLLQELKKEEIFAVILHEIGHSKTKTLSLLLTITTLIYTTIIVTSIYILITNIPNPTTTSITITTITATRIILPKIITKISQNIELKCDKYAATTLGTNKNWLISALKKIQKNTKPKTDPGTTTIYYILFHPYTTHPPIQKRINKIKQT
ncbi:Zn-dependent protease with chaperone function [Methanonatronarchaeum thermophilum]|uniref:Zn-dependent protease with chaperone function n=1 Tax=Methanonatronarchaeum thermophilum TaxID=1927129 RepID=A0A1Y3G9R1_9EURY|nr:M48 family metalloprotease [Methanonatronarchaeum thermophilum]OUJ18168.1 Zn-dependent protease with chaperone function [Methanonatronarchaeum thermophilum]